MKRSLFPHTTMPILAVSAAALALAGCSRNHPGEARAGTALPAVAVRVARVELKPAAVITEITGSVRPAQHAVLSAKVMGTIEDLPVTLGQQVRSGEILARISAAEIAARVLQAKSQLNVAQRDLDRERDMLGKGASTADMVKGLEDRVALTEAMVREADAMLGYTVIRAPFDGAVARKFVNAGDLAAPGAPLLEVEGTSGFQVEAGIPDSITTGLTPGSPLVVTVGADTFHGTLQELASAADPAAHTVSAKIAIPSGVPVRSGQFARVQIPGPAAKALLIPATAVIRFGQMEQVFVVGAENRAVLRLVKTGATRGDEVEILTGLDDGEQVVAAPPAGLLETQPLALNP